MKTLRDLAELVHAEEIDQAPTGETCLLGEFIDKYDYLDRILDGDSPLSDDLVSDAEYDAWVEAYAAMAQYEAEGLEYEVSMLF